MKVWTREEKRRDKERTKQDKGYYVSTFDLETVLSTPCSMVREQMETQLLQFVLLFLFSWWVDYVLQ